MSAVCLLRQTSADQSVYRPKRQRSLSSVFIALLLLLGGVETNPGPAADHRHGSRFSLDYSTLGQLCVRLLTFMMY